MSTNSTIQWCDSTVNPAMGCDGCELWPTPHQIATKLKSALVDANLPITSQVEVILDALARQKNATTIYRKRKAIARSVLIGALGKLTAPVGTVTRFAQAIAREFRCYAGRLHLRHGRDPERPEKRFNRGYAPIFEQVTLFPGRMAAMAKLSNLWDTKRSNKPWLDGARRLIFLSDMGDLLSRSVSFEYVHQEVIANVASPVGSQHVWLWLTKRPNRMAEFSVWLETQGILWPENLVGMTSVTSQSTVGRIELLKRVRCRYRGLSVEPLWGPVRLNLQDIDWTIVGGESGPGAKPFDLEWARQIRRQCKTTSFFVKQLGTRPVEHGEILKLRDRHGGDWDEWPRDLRIRELPPGFRD